MSSHSDHCLGLKRKLLVLIVAFALFSVFTGCVEVSEDTALVTRVIDGDTIEIAGGYRVRYIGIDAPEMNEPYYEQATRANRDLVLGKRVRLERDIEDKDKYGRLLRYVWVDDIMVNAELVRLGYARTYPYPPNLGYQSYLLYMEQEARQNRRGIWSDHPL